MKNNTPEKETVKDFDDEDQFQMSFEIMFHTQNKNKSTFKND